MTTAWPFDHKTMEAIKAALQEIQIEHEMSSEAFWHSLSYEDKCNAFQAVVSRIHNGELIEERSYRGMIYDVFSFKEDMYTRGMDCGFMALHNSISLTKKDKKLVENLGENLD